MPENKSETKKIKYTTKSVKFGGREITLYSLDGTTWSTKRDELQTIKERQEAQRNNLIAGKTGGLESTPAARGPAGYSRPAASEDEESSDASYSAEPVEEESEFGPETDLPVGYEEREEGEQPASEEESVNEEEEAIVSQIEDALGASEEEEEEEEAEVESQERKGAKAKTKVEVSKEVKKNKAKEKPAPVKTKAEPAKKPKKKVVPAKPAKKAPVKSAGKEKGKPAKEKKGAAKGGAKAKAKHKAKQVA